MSIAYSLGITSSDAITLYPEWNYRKGENQITTRHRTRSGKLYSYIWADYQTINFALNWITASNAAIVNSWWDSGTELLFFVVDGATTEVNSVLITNKDTPLAQLNQPYTTYYKGVIKLEEY